MSDRVAVPRAPRRVLAIVGKYPQAGAVKTRLAAAIGAPQAAELYRAFLLDLTARFQDAASRDGYTLVWSHAPATGDLRAVVGQQAHLLEQRGADLAERLGHLSADLAARGYTRVVIISSDSPHLPADWVRRAFAGLERRQVVLGPAEDGGYYLIGLRAAPIPPDLFRGIQMSTERVYGETLARAGALGLPVTTLPTTFDIDEQGDLERLAQVLARPQRGQSDAAPHTLAALRALGIAGAPATSTAAG